MFEIKHQEDVIVLVGRFDAAQTERALEVLNGLRQSVTIDCQRLDYISSAGLGALLATQKRLMSTGDRVKIVNLNLHIREIFTMTAFDRIFDIE